MLRTEVFDEVHVACKNHTVCWILWTVQERAHTSNVFQYLYQ